MKGLERRPSRRVQARSSAAWRGLQHAPGEHAASFSLKRRAGASPLGPSAATHSCTVGVWLLDGTAGSLRAALPALRQAIAHQRADAVLGSATIGRPDVLAVGGHDMSPAALRRRAMELVSVFGKCRLHLDTRTTPGLTALRVAIAPEDALARAIFQLASFQARHGLDTTVVLQQSPQEPAPALTELRLDELFDALAGHGPLVTPAVVNAAAALYTDSTYIDLGGKHITQLPCLRSLEAMATHHAGAADHP